MALKKTFAAAGIIFLHPEVQHPRLNVIQKTKKLLRRTGRGDFTSRNEKAGKLAKGQPRRSKASFHLYTASAVRIHAALAKECVVFFLLLLPFLSCFSAASSLFRVCNMRVADSP